jgi:zinc transport system substrate-binding protein
MRTKVSKSGSQRLGNLVRNGLVVAGLVVSALLLNACGDSSTQTAQVAAAEHDGVVRATCAPVAYLAWRLGGEDIPVELLLPEGEDPGGWQPDAETIGRFQRSMLIVANGAGFEEWVESASLPRSRLVLAADLAGVNLIEIEGIVHTHGPAGEHSHAGIDAHTWMDPVQTIGQADAIRNAMRQASREHAAAIDQRFVALESDLQALHELIAQIDVSGVRLVASHPAYNYLARRYDWTIHSMHFEPDQMPEEIHWSQLVETLGARTGPALMLWEAQPDQAIVDRLEAELGVKSVVFLPAESGAKEQYLDVMRANAQRLNDALQQLRAGG